MLPVRFLIGQQCVYEGRARYIQSSTSLVSLLQTNIFCWKSNATVYLGRKDCYHGGDQEGLQKRGGELKNSVTIKRLLHNFGIYLTQMDKNGKKNYISLSNYLEFTTKEEKKK